MRLNLLFICAILIVTSTYAQTKVMSYNIRYDNKNDGDNWWGHRKGEVVDMLQYYHPEIFGLQEVLPAQLAFIADHMDDYSYIGHGRDGVGTNSESTPIFYNKDKYELLHQETFWLSDTPQEISRGWDAALPRIALYGRFKNKSTGQTIHVINTHFDHRGELARHNSAQLLVDYIREESLSDESLIVMGDLNCLPSESPIGVLKEEVDDAHDLKDKPVYGPTGTFNGFDISMIADRRIDYMFTKNVVVESYRCIDDRRSNNLHVSDHFAVMIKIM